MSSKGWLTGLTFFACFVSNDDTNCKLYIKLGCNDTPMQRWTADISSHDTDINIWKIYRDIAIQ